MRASHSIKGAARIVQVEAAVKVAHALEDCFIAAQQNILTVTSDRIDVLLMGVDLLSKLGAVDEQFLSEQLAKYDADVDDVVVALEEMVSTAEKAASESSASSVDAAPVDATPVDAASIKTVRSQTGADGAVQNAAFDKALAPVSGTAELQLPAEDESNRMIRISADNLSRLMGLAGEILVESNRLQPFTDALLSAKRKQQSVISLLKEQQVAAQNNHLASIDTVTSRLQSCHSLLSDRLEDIEQLSQRFAQLSDRLYREVIAGHLCAFEEGIHGYGRLVRDIAKQQGKQVSLEIKGLTTQIDRDILAKLDTPITHLLTNAIIHGIEPPEVRLAKGKPAHAQLKLSAAHRSGMLVIEIEDDGAGVDFVRLRQQVVEKGLVAANVADALSQPELIEFLFLPGFSTASQVDKLAGRGYGLDLARTMAQSVGGSLTAVSPVERPNAAAHTHLAGVRFRFHLPLTLSVVRSLLFEAAGEAYAFRLSSIFRVIKLDKEQIHYSESRPYFHLEEENISLISIRQILDLSGSMLNGDANDSRLAVVVVGEMGARYGICVDRLLEETDLVVRPLDSRLGKVPNVSAASLSETGAPVLILDAADIIRSAERAVAGAGASQMAATADTAASARAQKRVLVVDDSMTVRAMEKKLLQNRGYAVDLAVDGAEGWNTVRMQHYDLVITDVDMPRMNGIELIRKIRGYEATKKLPVIVVSYKDREADQMAGLEAGANYYLTKSSFHDDGLITAVVDLIGP